MKYFKGTLGAILLCLSSLLCHPGAWAQNEAALQKAFDDARTVAKPGPVDVELVDQAVLKLPAGHVYIPQPQATALLNAMGNPGRDERLHGLVFPQGSGDWFVIVRYEKAGYIRDDDAKEWNADDLLKSYREGTEAANEERTKLGAPAIEITGWAEKPTYDAATHRLVWAMASKNKGAPDNEGQGVNYNTYALGREGYFSLNLVTALKSLGTDKSSAHTLLSALEYKAGKRYADFDASTDKVAEYGLAALVLGAGAKKLGLFAVAAAFFAKFAKVIVLALVALGGVAIKLFRKNKVR